MPARATAEQQPGGEPVPLHAAGAPRGTAELHLPAQSTQLAAARSYVREAAADFGLDPEAAYELEYAVNEAATNAIKHGRPDERGLIRLCAMPGSDRLTITVRDYGTFAGPLLPSATADSESGRGLALMGRFVDEVHVDIQPGTTTVGLSKLRR